MARFDNQTFRGQRVDLDGNDFHGCQFLNCQLHYAGKAGPHLAECFIQNPTINLEGAAANTIAFLHALYHGGGEFGRRHVEMFFDEAIRRP